MGDYLAYIRVSTVRQGERGTSLVEQRSAIEAYATRHNLVIKAWYEEMETAAKQGRRQFSRLLSDLKRGHGRGVIIHKVDRSARNLRDWAQLGDLIDAGADVRFAHESIDLSSRGGRLSADIQAVVAADFIRNHRQTVRMGFEGRLKQGLYPLPAPRGYADQGGGKPKAIHPVEGPLVRQAFELYATGEFSYESLRLELAQRGLRGRTGKPLSLGAMSIMLRCSFYVGLIRIETTGQVFEGIHERLIPRTLFDRVQVIATTRLFDKTVTHDFAFRRMITCKACERVLVGERQRGHVYYRCHTRTCRGTSIREATVDQAVRECLAKLDLTDEEFDRLKADARALLAKDVAKRAERDAGYERDLGACEARIARLTDALVDGVIDKATFDARHRSLLAERQRLREAAEAKDEEPFVDRVLEKLELGRMAYLGYDLANEAEKREIAKCASSNIQADGKYLVFTPSLELQSFFESRGIQ